MFRLSGIHPPLPTPLKDDSVDRSSLDRLIERLSPYVDGLLYGGSISETASLSLDERLLVIDQVTQRLGGSRVSVSIADNSMVNTRRLAEAAQERGVRVLVLSCPNYYTNDLAMLTEYLGMVASFLEPPATLCLYDNPYTSHTWLSPADILRLGDAVPALTHVKVTDKALDKVSEIVDLSELTVLSGDDAVLWHHLRTGANGIMTALPLIFPAECRQLWSAVVAQRFDEAKGIWERVVPYAHAALELPDYPYFVKATLHRQEWIASDEVRLPLRRVASHRVQDALELV